MNKTFACFGSFALLLAGASPVPAQSFSSAIVLSEHGFPAADPAGSPAGALEAAMPGRGLSPLGSLGRNCSRPIFSRKIANLEGNQFTAEQLGDLVQTRSESPK